LYLDLRRAGYEVYTGKIRNKELDFVAQKADKLIYIQCAYLLTDPETIEREYGALEVIDDNYEKYVVTLDDLIMPSNKGIKHVQAWNLAEIL
jgi:predicted AAA+ superfamily ATPase